MRDLKVHLLVHVRRTVPKYFESTSTYVLCNLHNAQRVTNDRKLVTCGICNHFLKEYCDKHVIERGNVFTPGRQVAQLRDSLNTAFKKYVGRTYNEKLRNDLYKTASLVILTVCSCGKKGCDCTERSGGF
jgi:hypothetical protein